MLCKNIGISNNHLTFAGVDTTELAKKYGTPLFLMDEEKIRENCRTYKKDMKDSLGEGSFPLYADNTQWILQK